MRRRLLATALTAGLLLPAASASAADSETFGIRLVDAPESRRDDPRALSAIVDHLVPGTTISRRVEVGNESTRVLELEVFGGAADIRDGEFRAAEEPPAEHELVDWISVDPPAVTLEPGQRQMATVTIDVPADAVAGEQYAVIWAAATADGPGPVTAVNRVGVRIYLSVGPGGEPRSDFTIDELVPGRLEDGKPVLQILLRNIGGRALDPSGEAELRDGPGGLSAGPLALPGIALAPGQTGTLQAELDPAIPAGPWTAHVTLRSGRVEREATAQITFPDAGAGAAVPAEAVQRRVPIPLIVVAGLLLVLLLLALLILIGRRWKDEDD